MTATYVFIDTNILLFCSMGTRAKHDPVLLSALVDALKNTGAKLLLPDVVELEYRNLMRTRGELYRKASETAMAEALKHLSAETDKQKVAAVFAQINTDRESAMKEAAELFDKLAGSEHTIRVASTGDMVARALTFSISGRAPSKGKTAKERADLTPSEPGYTLEPDCLIVAALRAALQTVGSESQLLFCTDNIKDFAAQNQATGSHDLHPDIMAEMPCGTTFFRTLPEMLEGGLAEGKLSEDTKVLYEDAVQEAVALTAQLTGVKSKESTVCPSCSTKVGVEIGVLPGSTVHPVCPVCHLGFFAHRSNDGTVFTRMGGTARTKSVNVSCPECGNRIPVRLKPDDPRHVERVCFECLHRLTIDAENSLVTGVVKVDPIPAAVIRIEAKGPMLECPLCGRCLHTIGNSELGSFAICSSNEHETTLLRAESEVDNSKVSG